MNIIGENVKLKTNYSGNETKLEGIINCQCGRKVIIDETISDSTFDFKNEKELAIANNILIENPIIPDAVLIQEKLNKAIELINYLLANGMFNASVIEKANTDKINLI